MVFFNTFSNLSGITTPLVIGYLFETQQNFNGAILFIGAHSLFAIATYHFLVKEIREFNMNFKVVEES